MIWQRFQSPQRVFHPKGGEQQRTIIRGACSPDFSQPEWSDKHILPKIVGRTNNIIELRYYYYALSALGGYFVSFPRASPGFALGCLEMRFAAEGTKPKRSSSSRNWPRSYAPKAIDPRQSNGSGYPASSSRWVTSYKLENV
jgi:hypothetical protein